MGSHHHTAIIFIIIQSNKKLVIRHKRRLEFETFLSQNFAQCRAVLCPFFRTFNAVFGTASLYPLSQLPMRDGTN